MAPKPPKPPRAPPVALVPPDEIKEADLHPSLRGSTGPVKRERKSAKYRLFALEYLVDRNARRAAEAAGFAPSTANALLAHPDVRALVDTAIVRHGQQAEIRAEDLVRELTLIATSDLGEMFNDQDELIPLKKIPKDVRKAISSYSVERGVTQGGEPKVRKKITLWSKNEAALGLLRMLVEAEEAKKRLLESMSDEELYEKARSALAAREKDDNGTV